MKIQLVLKTELSLASKMMIKYRYNKTISLPYMKIHVQVTHVGEVSERSQCWIIKGLCLMIVLKMAKVMLEKQCFFRIRFRIWMNLNKT
jgi:hypothetical protein